MPRRNLIPLAILAVLAVGALVFAVIGQMSAPSATTITVQNATATTFGSPTGSTSFVLDLITTLSSGATSGSLKQEHLIDYQPPGRMVVIDTSTKDTTVLHQTSVTCALSAYTAMLQGPTEWNQKGNTYMRTESVADYTARVPSTVVGMKCEPRPLSARGQVTQTVLVRSGYLVAARVRIVVPPQTLNNGRTAASGTETETLLFIEIGGVPVRTIKS